MQGWVVCVCSMLCGDVHQKGRGLMRGVVDFISGDW